MNARAPGQVRYRRGAEATRAMWWTLLLLGCFKPTDTGPTAMVGHVVGPDGAPIAGVDVQTIESRWTTDAAGRFEAHYKPPDQRVWLHWAELRWQRAYRPEDRGTDVQITLPRLEPVSVACDLDAPCTAEFTWTLPDGLTATAFLRCDPDAPTPLGGLPTQDPVDGTCRARATDRGRPVRLAPGPTPRIQPPPEPILVTFATDDVPPPKVCAVFVDGQTVPMVAEGRYRATGWGTVDLFGACDHIPTAPRRLTVTGPTAVELEWNRAVPRADLHAVLPDGARRAYFARLDDADGGWVLPIAADEPASIALPPLTRGTYALGVGVTPAELRATAADPSDVADAFHWRPTASGAGVATLRLSRDLPYGRIGTWSDE